MYRIVIVDDEEIMREGLMNLVDWESMGFEVTANFEDGQEALEYLEENKVDVLLTDIKMTFVSGLDLARYVNDQKLSTKVVLISGYKDFEYAREAVNYNVVQYLLKPISLKDIQKVFTEIRTELDREREAVKKQEYHQKKYNELLSAMRDQFFIDLVLGALRNPDEMNRRLKLLDLDLNTENSPCCLWTARIDNYQEYIDKNWGYGSEDFKKAIENILCSWDDELKFHFITAREGRFRILIIGTNSILLKDFTSRTKSYIEKSSQMAEKLLGIKLIDHREDYFDNLSSLAVYTGTSKELEFAKINGKSIDLNIEIQDHLLDQERLLMTHIQNGNRESAISLLDQIIEEIYPLGIKQIQDMFFDLFKTLMNHLEKNGVDLSRTFKAEWNSMRIFEINTVEELKQFLIMQLDMVIKEAIDVGEQYNYSIISYIKQYINENYNQDITLENVADFVFLSPVYVSRIFKEKTGENFSDYLIRIRMEKALELLSEPRYKVYEIGYKVGYRSTKHFYKLFKQYHGCTPTEYRKKLCAKKEG